MRLVSWPVRRRGDRSAFAALVQAHQGYLRKLMARVCQGDQGRADDLAQEAFIRAWRALPGFRGEARFRTWLTRLAYSALSAERPPLPTVDEAPPDLEVRATSPRQRSAPGPGPRNGHALGGAAPRCCFATTPTSATARRRKSSAGRSAP